MDELSLPRWYHGPMGRLEAEQPEVTVPPLTAEETAAWLEWARAEIERQAEQTEEDPKC